MPTPDADARIHALTHPRPPPTLGANMQVCSLHQGAAAGWRCAAHGLLCPECTGARAAGLSRVAVCVRCGEPAERLRAPRRLRRPFWRSLPDALGWPLRLRVLPALLTAAVALRVLFFLGALAGPPGTALAAALGAGALLTGLLLVVRDGAAGGDDLPALADLHGLRADLLLPLLRALLAGLWVAGPPLLWLAGSPAALGELLLDGIVPEPEAGPALLLLLGALLFPLALAAAALRRPLAQVVNPLAAVLVALKLGSDFWLASLSFVACAVASAAVWGEATAFFAQHPIPFAYLWATVTGLYFQFAAFRALGLLARVRGDDLGAGTAEDFLEPVLDAEPAGRVTAALAAELSAGLDRATPRPPASAPVWPLVTPHAGSPAMPAALFSRAAVSVTNAPEPVVASVTESPPAQGQPAIAAKVAADDRGPAATAAPPARPASLPPRAAPASALASAPGPHDPVAPGLLARSMTESDLGRAVQVLADSGRSIPAGTLSAPAWVELAKTCLARAQALKGAAAEAMAALGVLAYRRAAEVAPNGPLAPQAFLQAARLYDEFLRDRARSDALLAELARRYPQTAEGQFAVRRIAARAGE